MGLKKRTLFDYIVPLFSCIRSLIICSLVLRFSASVSFFCIVIVFSFVVVLFFFCSLDLLFSCTLLILSSCPFVSRPLHGARVGCKFARQIILSSSPLVVLFSLRQRQVGGYSPPLDFVTICCSHVPQLRPTRLCYTDYLGHSDYLRREHVKWGAKHST